MNNESELEEILEREQWEDDDEIDLKQMDFVHYQLKHLSSKKRQAYIAYHSYLMTLNSNIILLCLKVLIIVDVIRFFI